MRVLVHLSDLHFGRIDETLLAPLLARVRALAPHLVVVSGDLTQRARRAQFARARAFLDALPAPYFAVPGNHDVPLYDLTQRLLRPFARYRRYVSPELEPLYVDDEIAVTGVNTARTLVVQAGRINWRQVRAIRERLEEVPAHRVRIVVTHHPFDVPLGHDRRKMVGRAAMAMQALARCGVDLCLAGHLHIGHVRHGAQHTIVPGRGPLLVQAGTATSTRARGEVNSFNALFIEGKSVRIERYGWDGEARTFAIAAHESYRGDEHGWHPLEAVPA
jgi:3',5'-cyclic AMP phosphodiesterase CpdA